MNTKILETLEFKQTKDLFRLLQTEQESWNYKFYSRPREQ